MLHSVRVVLKHFLLPLRIRFGLRHQAAPVVVEIGANDGKAGDPLFDLIRRNERCTALLVEPVPYLFERLTNNYKGMARVALENVAVAASTGHRLIYFIDPCAKEFLPNLPPYFEELASFEREKVASLVGTTSVYIKELKVETISLDALLLKHRLSRVDLLQIDTEGYDYEVLKTFPFERMKPALVCFEHSHLGEVLREESRNFMAAHGYSVERWGKDFVCVANSA